MAIPEPPRRGRRPRTYGAVLDATAQLLRTTSLAELSVAQILAAAGVGRTSFYEHFSSKDDVVVKLMESLSDEVAVELEPMFARGERSPDEAFALGLGNLVETASRYAPLVIAVSEEWPAIPELKQIWFAMLGDFTNRDLGDFFSRSDIDSGYVIRTGIGDVECFAIWSKRHPVRCWASCDEA